MIAFLASASRRDSGTKSFDRAREADIGEALAAVQRLCDAENIDLLAFDTENNRATSFATCLKGTVAIVPRSILVAMQAQGAMPGAAPTFCWIEEQRGTAARRLLVRLTDGRSSRLFLLLTPSSDSAAARARLERRVPDLALLIRMHVDLRARASETDELKAAATEALDHGDCGIIAVRRDHSVVLANAVASHQLAEHKGLCLRRNLLRPANHVHAVRFEAALESVVDAVARDPAKRGRAKVMLLDGGDQARPTIVVIVPASAAPGPSGQSRGAAAIVYTLQPAHGTTRGLDTLCRLHGLSRVEADLIAHLIDGLTLTETATRMRIKVETARTYLKQIFNKTGLHRQADLVGLMTRYQRAIRGDFNFQPA